MMFKTCSAIRFDAVSTPLAVTPELRDFICSHLHEYGAGAGIQPYLAADYAWEIRGADNAIIGYAWVSTMTGIGMPHGLYLDMAVFDRFQNCGVGGKALEFVASELQRTGVPRLFAQVNNIDPKTGLRVRRWLLHNGYKLAMRDEHFGKRLARYSDEEYVLKYALPVYLCKSLA